MLLSSVTFAVNDSLWIFLPDAGVEFRSTDVVFYLQDLRCLSLLTMMLEGAVVCCEIFDIFFNLEEYDSAFLDVCAR